MIILSDSIIESFKTRTTFLPTKQSENGSSYHTNQNNLRLCNITFFVCFFCLTNSCEKQRRKGKI